MQLVHVMGEPDTLALLIRNLVDNAIRYTARDGTVVVGVHATTGETTLEVLDSGPGVPPAQREQVFQRFWLAPGSRTAGSGLGLSIVKRITDLHYASVEFADPPPRRQGARVLVRFPRIEAD